MRVEEGMGVRSGIVKLMGAKINNKRGKNQSYDLEIGSNILKTSVVDVQSE